MGGQIGCRLHGPGFAGVALHARRSLLWSRAAVGEGARRYMTLGPVTSSTDTTTPTTAEVAAAPPGTTAKAIEGRSLGRIAWTRLKKDRIAMLGGATVVFL